MRLEGYTRVSRVGGREGPTFISPAEQRRSIETWAAAHGHVIAGLHEDLDQPGSRANRPGLNKAMAACEAGESKGIVVAKLDRFGRSVVHLAGLLERLRAADAALFTVAEGIDTSGTTGKLIADILGAIAEWELGRIRDNWAVARGAAAERGVYLSEAPVGYRKRPGGGLIKADSAPLIADAFRRRASGESWAGICRWLDSEGIASKRGGKWTVSALRRLVSNRAYLGEANGRPTHEPIVAPSVFEAANVIRGVAPGRSGRASGLLSGILRCAGCRYAMKLSQGSHDRREYRCKSSRGEVAGGRCEHPASISAHLIDPFILKAFWGWVGNYRATGLTPDGILDEAESVVAVAEAELDAALDRSLVEALGGDDSAAYLSLIRRRREAVELARASLADAGRNAQALAVPVQNLRDLWPNLTLYEQRKLLASAFDCVFLRRGRSREDVSTRTLICLHGEAPELPVKGRRWTPQPFDFPSPPEAITENG